MAPEAKTTFRRLAIVLTGAGGVTLAYVLHSFTGWARAALMLACFVLLGFAIQLLIDEGRERERARR